MKNILIYNVIKGKERYETDVLYASLKSQIDNSLRFGWNRDDIILGTNFDFEHNGVKNINLNDICEWNIFCNKWYGVRELMRSGIIDDEFWFHDQDAWQINKIEFPKFDGEIAGSTYVYTPEWNSCSMFFKKTALNIVEYIVEFMELNKSLKLFGDEHYLAIIRNQTEVLEYLSTINNKYNVGLTHMEYRYEAADKPVCVIGFQPQVEKSLRVFNGENNTYGKNFIDDEMDFIFKTHFKEYREFYGET